MTIIDEIAKHRSVKFSQYQELALYHEELGFYETGGAAGQDFLTSPQLGTVFAEVIARALDSWWDELGNPSPFFVIEIGAASGKLSHDILQTSSRCQDVLQYVAVERSRLLRESQTAAAVDVRADIPMDLHEQTGVVIANELLDNIPVDVFDDRGEVLVKVKSKRLSWSREFVGSPFPEQTASAKWLRDALSVFERGRVVVIDYMRTTAEMRDLPIEQWLRSYRGHSRSGVVFEEPGRFDITCDVAIDQLRWVREPSLQRSQADFLHAHGIKEIEQQAGKAWKERAATGDLESLVARSRLEEVKALTDPIGLGGFSVVEWVGL